MAKKAAAAKTTRTRARRPAEAAASPPAWPTRLGALAKAQESSAKVIENLRRQGQRLEERTRAAAADTAAKAREMQQIAGGTLDKLEQVFEDRVARALSKLGIYTQNDIQRLSERVDELSGAVNRLLQTQGVAVPVRPPAKKRAAKAAPASAKAPAAKAPATRTSRRKAKGEASGA